MKKIKYLFYPLWRIEELEKELKDAESKGMKLKEVKRFNRFVFEESAPKDTLYIVTYNMTNDYRPDMFEWERILLSDYKANEIKSKSSYSFFRITQDERELKGFIDYRNAYFKHVLLHYFLISLIFLFVLSFGMIWCLIGNYPIVEKILLSLFFVVILIGTVYQLYGYINQ